MIVRGCYEKGRGGYRFHMNTDTCTASLMFCNVLLPCLFSIHSFSEQNEGVNKCLVKLIKNQEVGFALSVVFLLPL